MSSLIFIGYLLAGALAFIRLLYDLIGAKFGEENIFEKGKQPAFMLSWDWLRGVIILFLILFPTVGCSSPAVPETPTPTEEVQEVGEKTATSTAKSTNTTSPVATETLIPTLSSTSTLAPTETSVSPIPTLGIGSTLTNPVDNAVMVAVPAGEFTMGSDHGGSNESPVHTVYLDDYWISQYEITNQQFAEFLNANGNQIEGGVTWLIVGDDIARIHQSGENWQADSGYERHPVVNVSWYGAKSYCDWIGGSLPTEAEWEKAARGGLDGMTYPWGDQDPVCNRGAENGAQFGPCSGQTEWVGYFAPNGYGLYDTAGNVWEWVSSCYQDYPYNVEDGREELEVSCMRVLRGGSWYDLYGGSLRVAYRSYGEPGYADGGTGFRCVFLP